jgi:hypothetical protein
MDDCMLKLIANNHRTKSAALVSSNDGVKRKIADTA